MKESQITTLICDFN